jgi:hypothetical protein
MAAPDAAIHALPAAPFIDFLKNLRLIFSA